MQSIKEGAFPKASANLGAHTGLGSSWELARGRKKPNQPRQQHPSVLSLYSHCLLDRKVTMKPLPSRVMKTDDLRVRKIIALMPGNCLLII